MDVADVVEDGQSKLELLAKALADMNVVGNHTLSAIVAQVRHTFHVVHRAPREMLLKQENSIGEYCTKLEGIAQVVACVP